MEHDELQPPPLPRCCVSSPAWTRASPRPTKFSLTRLVRRLARQQEGGPGGEKENFVQNFLLPVLGEGGEGGEGGEVEGNDDQMPALVTVNGHNYKCSLSQ